MFCPQKDRSGATQENSERSEPVVLAGVWGQN